MHEKILPILRQVRPLLLPQWGTAAVIDQKDASAVNVVTQLDHDVEELVSTKLAEMFPEIPFVGEERGGNRDAEKFWLMDPIDGTQHFVRGLPFCTSMLALVDRGEVVFSAIYDFIRDDMYWAEKGKGAYCNDRRISVSNRTLAQAYIGCEIRLDTPENVAVREALRQRTILVNTIVAGWEFIMVACGKLDARIQFAPFGNDYDYAPGSLLVREAGGVVTNVGSSEYDYRNTNFIAANPTIYAELTEGTGAIFPKK